MLRIRECPVETTLSLIDGKWKLLIIRTLMQGKKRYGEVKGNIYGISSKVLTAQLGELMEDHLVVKTIYPEMPPRTEYELTPLGKSLGPILLAMKSWGSDFLEQYHQGAYPEFNDQKQA